MRYKIRVKWDALDNRMEIYLNIIEFSGLQQVAKVIS